MKNELSRTKKKEKKRETIIIRTLLFVLNLFSALLPSLVFPQLFSLFLSLPVPHLVILAGHDIGDAEVSKHDGADAKQIVVAAPHNRLVEANRLTVLALLV